MHSRLHQMLWSLGILLAMAGLGQAEVFRTTLDNGLTVLIEENHANPVVAVEVFVRTGSIYEQEYLGSGISHFFEHIIHGGTTSTRSEAESRRLLEAIGNNSNAYTTVDHTAYYINATTEHWRTALELLADWMLHSSITPEEFEREKGVVQRELEQDLDNPEQMLAQIAMETRFQVHPARYPLDVLAYILANGNSARLVRHIQEEQQLVYAIQASSYTPAYAAGTLAVSAALAPEQLPAAEAAILQELYRLREELVSPEELAKAKKQKLADYVFERQTVEQQAHGLGLDMLSTYDPNFSEGYVRIIQHVTAEDIREVARLYLREETLVQAVVRPKSDTPSALAPTPVAQREPVLKKVLANGMTLLLKRNPALPTVAMQAYFKGWVRAETPDTNWLSLLTSSLLPKG